MTKRKWMIRSKKNKSYIMFSLISIFLKKKTSCSFLQHYGIGSKNTQFTILNMQTCKESLCRRKRKLKTTRKKLKKRLRRISNKRLRKRKKKKYRQKPKKRMRKKKTKIGKLILTIAERLLRELIAFQTDQTKALLVVPWRNSQLNQD